VAVAFVQATDNDTGVTPGEADFGSSTPVDNLLVAMIVFNSGATWGGITDDNSNTWTQLGTEITAGALKARAYWAKNGTAAVDKIRNTLTGTVTKNHIFCVEISGQDLTTPIDVSGLHPHAGATADFTDSLTLTNAGELFLSLVAPVSGSTQLNPSTGWTHIATSVGATYDYQVFSTSGSKSVTYDNVNFPSPIDHIDIQVAIQPPGGGGDVLQSQCHV
jgi:hypothetical protein